MKPVLHLQHGQPIPSWVEALEAGLFDIPWGPLDATAHLLLIEPCAFIRWCVIPAAGEAELVRIAVDETMRRQGLARQLMEASETMLLAQRIDTIHLEVRTSNAPARALYEAMGWSPQRIRKGYYRDGEDAVIYGKPLAP